MAEFTHFKKDGSAVMVDVHEKPDTYRAASATGTIRRKKAMCSALHGWQESWGRRRMRS